MYRHDSSQIHNQTAKLQSQQQVKHNQQQQNQSLQQQYLNINFHMPNQIFTGNFDNLNLITNNHLSQQMQKQQQQQQQQQKKISLKKLEEEYCKTLEQAVSPNSSTINLENLKKTQSMHFMKAASGTSSPQQVKSRSSIGKYMQGPTAYNNFYNSSQNRNSTYVSKSQVGNTSQSNGAISGSRSKTTNRKKRNLYTSMGNYYQSQISQQQNQNNSMISNTGNGSRGTKQPRLHNNFLENLEQTNYLLASNQINPGDLTKKRNKSQLITIETTLKMKGICPTLHNQ